VAVRLARVRLAGVRFAGVRRGDRLITAAAMTTSGARGRVGRLAPTSIVASPVAYTAAAVAIPAAVAVAAAIADVTAAVAAPVRVAARSGLVTATAAAVSGGRTRLRIAVKLV
jgi:hypothetical protein